MLHVGQPRRSRARAENGNPINPLAFSNSIQMPSFQIQFAQNYDDEDQNQSILDEAMPSVFVFKSSLTKSESHKMGQNELWNFHAKELIQAYQNHDDLNCIKYLAITSATT